MAGGKNSQKSLKKPDAFQMLGVKMTDWILKNQTLVYAIVGAVAAIGAGLWGYGEYAESKRASRVEAVSVAELKMLEENEAFSKAQEKIREEITALEVKLNPTDKKAKKPSTSEKKKLEAQIADLKKSTEDSRPDYKESTKLFLEIYAKLGATPEGWYAAMRGVKGLIDQKNYLEAEKIALSVSKEAGDHLLYGAQSKVLLFGLYQQNGKIDESLKMVDEIISSASDEEKPEWLLSKAKVLITKNNKEEAAKVIDQIIKDHGTSRQAKMAQNIKSILL